MFGREVNLASRLEGLSGRGRIFISQATYEHLLRDDPALASRCVAQPPAEVKGIKALVQVYEVPWRSVEEAEAGNSEGREPKAEGNPKTEIRTEPA